MSDGLDDRLLTAPEAAEILRVTPRYVWRLGREGRIERVKPPGSKYVYFPESGLRRYIESGRQAPVQIGASAMAPSRAPVVRAQRRERRRFR